MKQWTLLPPEDERWLRLLRDCPQANPFHHPAWSRVMVHCYGGQAWIAACLESPRELVCGIPFILFQGPGGRRRWISLPFTDHVQPLGRDPCSTHDVERCIQTLRNDHEGSLVELRLNCPPEVRPNTRTDFVLHRLTLQPDFDAVARNIHPMHRRNARLAEQRGVEIVNGRGLNFLEIYYQLHRLTRQRQGVPVQPWKFFVQIGKELLERRMGFVTLAFHEGHPAAGALFLYWRNYLMYKFGASDPRFWQFRPNDLIFWKTIRYGCEQGFQTLDFGRSDLTQTGLRDYKQRWGAEETPLSYSYLPAPRKSIARGRLLPILNAIIRTGPPWFCQAIGELFYRFSV